MVFLIIYTEINNTIKKLNIKNRKTNKLFCFIVHYLNYQFNFTKKNVCAGLE